MVHGGAHREGRLEREGKREAPESRARLSRRAFVRRRRQDAAERGQQQMTLYPQAGSVRLRVRERGERHERRGGEPVREQEQRARRRPRRESVARTAPDRDRVAERASSPLRNTCFLIWFVVVAKRTAKHGAKRLMNVRGRVLGVVVLQQTPHVVLLLRFGQTASASRRASVALPPRARRFFGKKPSAPELRRRRRRRRGRRRRGAR